MNSTKRARNVQNFSIKTQHANQMMVGKLIKSTDQGKNRSTNKMKQTEKFGKPGRIILADEHAQV